MATSGKQRSKFAALHRQWWRLHMSEKFSSGTINPKKETNYVAIISPWKRTWPYVWTILIFLQDVLLQDWLKLAKWFWWRWKCENFTEQVIIKAHFSFQIKWAKKVTDIMLVCQMGKIKPKKSWQLFSTCTIPIENWNDTL